MNALSFQRLAALLAISLVLFAVLAAGVWFMSKIERVTHIKELGYPGEARYNPLLAARRLLETMQIKVKAVHHLPHIKHSLQPGDVLFWVQNYRALSVEKSQTVLDWVAHGGHALMISNSIENQEDTEQDPLLEALHVQQRSLELTDQAILDTPPATVRLPDAETTFQVDFQPDYVLNLKETAQPTETHVLHLPHEKGHVTVLSDVWFLHNARIGEHDHAHFFWALLNLQQRPERVWLVYPLNRGLVDNSGIRRKPTQQSNCEDCEAGDGADSEAPSLWALAWNKAWFLLISLCALIIAMLWLASRRFGALLTPSSTQRRRLLEHIEASGEFLWQTGQANQLLRGLRQEVFKDLQRQQPTWLSLARADLSQCLGEHCALPPARVQSALYHVQFTSTAAFTDAVQCLKHIRRAL